MHARPAGGVIPARSGHDCPVRAARGGDGHVRRALRGVTARLTMVTTTCR
ncbi:hypothetical protein Ae168Ps1_2265c [Pseudonocardia sp. Ae168_Ps1]|nr:hypothetical protein Ae150APs1_2258c [Pseudonocardia sp. Ae150A_Ps1]OLL79859.1 hypothetical protein Ae168Ps1_2265c [Pseudonocardia sp. Ae168_Ps1]OLL86007.1 hypothetical protein Ae263Ps1_3062 [Pseudonocardia sp. Ae263_Ps1]OLL93962.1 hypothetical protein Ae356Ps1_3859c [Pseudonocardia sp. Ae356_Ps1]